METQTPETPHQAESKTTKTPAEVHEQIARISRKLIDRAAKLAPDGTVESFDQDLGYDTVVEVVPDIGHLNARKIQYATKEKGRIPGRKKVVRDAEDDGRYSEVAIEASGSEVGIEAVHDDEYVNVYSDDEVLSTDWGYQGQEPKRGDGFDLERTARQLAEVRDTIAKTEKVQAGQEKKKAS